MTAKATILICLLASASAGADFAPATYVTTAEIEATLKQASPDAATFDKVIKTVNADGYKLSIVILRRTRPEANALSHNRVTEVYQVISGSGILVTGGTLTNTRPNDLTAQAAGPGLSGTMVGGESRHIGPGDVAIILPGVPHKFMSLEGVITYLVTRVEATGSY